MLAGKDFYKRHRKRKEREKCILNEYSENLGTEIINNIQDESIDFDLEVDRNKSKNCLHDLVLDLNIVDGIQKLTEKQRVIIYKSIVEMKSNKVIAKDLEVTEQAVSKNKISALNKLRRIVKEG